MALSWWSFDHHASRRISRVGLFDWYQNDVWRGHRDLKRVVIVDASCFYDTINERWMLASRGPKRRSFSLVSSNWLYMALFPVNMNMLLVQDTFFFFTCRSHITGMADGVCVRVARTRDFWSVSNTASISIKCSAARTEARHTDYARICINYEKWTL